MDTDKLLETLAELIAERDTRRRVFGWENTYPADESWTRANCTTLAQMVEDAKTCIETLRAEMRDRAWRDALGDMSKLGGF